MNTQFMCLSLNDIDKLKLIAAPPNVVEVSILPLKNRKNILWHKFKALVCFILFTKLSKFAFQINKMRPSRVRFCHVNGVYENNPCPTL